MCIIPMYTTKCTKLVHTNSLVLIGLIVLLLVVGVRLVPLGLTRFITLINLVTLVTFPLFFFFEFWELVAICCTNT